MEELHGKVFMEGDVERELYVRRLQTKKERQRELRDKHASVSWNFQDSLQLRSVAVIHRTVPRPGKCAAGSLLWVCTSSHRSRRSA
eukprot:51233-Eustigmatos_ZCMA.PRE.1